MKFFSLPILIIQILLAPCAQADFGNLLSLQRLDNEEFVALCTDHSSENVGIADLNSRNVCNQNAVEIKEGVYEAIEGYTSYYNQRVKTNFVDGRLQYLTITWIDSGITLDYPCVESICQVRYDGRDRVVKVLEKDKYVYKGSGSEATFVWKTNSLVAPTRLNGRGDQ